MASGRCYRHGGATPSGTASPHFKHGRYSRNLPARLLSRYEEAQEDRLLLELREEIALVDAQIVEVVGKADSGDSGWLLKELSKAMVKVRKARRKEDSAAEEAALNRLEELESERRENPRAWREVRRLINQRRRLVESERRCLVEAGQMISIEEAMVLVAALTDSVKRHVNDPRVQAAIGEDFERLIDAEP